MTADQIHAELTAAKRGLKRCACGSAVVMAYEPGATFIHCIAERRDVAVLPDWQPAELASAWNRGEPDLTGPAA